MPAKKTAKQQRKVTAPAVTNHGVDHGHESRVDEMSEYDATHQQEPAAWIRPSSLDAPEPRKGMVQRWVRKSLFGADDPKNLNRSWREGWRPRSPDTLPEDWRIYATFADKNEGMIVVDDLILMEIDADYLARKRAAIRKITEDQMASVEHDLEKTQLSGHPIVKEHNTSVTHPAIKPRHRHVSQVADDE